MKRHVVTCVAALVMVSAGLSATGAAARPASSPVVEIKRISGPTPFGDGCGDGGTAIADSEVEPHLAVDPTDANHLIATWQQDRYGSGGGARSNLVTVSRDGGTTWTAPSTVPGISRCTGDSDYERATDPWVAIDAAGRTYLASLSFAGLAAAEHVSASSDGGATWERPVAVETDSGDLYLEKETIAADPRRAGHLYMLWERGEPDPTGGLVLFDDHMRFARSEDGGATWTTPITVPPDEPTAFEFPLKVVPIARPGGNTELVVVYARMLAPSRAFAPGPISLKSVRSHDLGRTWSAPTTIVEQFDSGPPSDVERVERVRAEAWIAAVTSGPGGTINVVWALPARGLDRPRGTDLYLARSNDAGITWTTRTIARLPYQAFTPAVAVHRDGTIGITYYDTRDDIPGDDSFTAGLRFASSRDNGVSWSTIDLGGNFDMRQAPVANGQFLGDYTGLVPLPKGFGAAVSMSPPQATVGPADVFFARISFRNEQRHATDRPTDTRGSGTSRR